MIKRIINDAIRITGFQFTKIPSLQNQLKAGQFRWLENFGIETIIDIGANTGQFSLWINQILPYAKIYCFEPLDSCFNELKNNLRNIDQVEYFDFALGNEEGEAEIFKNEFAPSSSLLKMSQSHIDIFPHTKVSKKQKIKLSKLDSFQNKIDYNGKVLVKIDVQGFELNVLNGALKSLDKIDILIIENSFFSLYEDQPLFADIFNFLNNRQFDYFGSLEQFNSPESGLPVQEDSIFINRNRNLSK